MIKKMTYNGVEIDPDKIHIEWTDHWGNHHTGGLIEFLYSEVDDAIEENDPGW